jgi:hypothetical protein
VTISLTILAGLTTAWLYLDNKKKTMKERSTK